MGILLQDAELLAGLARGGLSCDKTLTLGRQQLFFDPDDLAHKLTRMGFSEDHIRDFIAESRHGGPSDALFKLFGAREIQAVDYSDYEGASIQHDLNLPVAASYHNQFDLVFDGGTLEHIFHLPVGLSNAMNMVRAGGKFISIAPANNFLGHGFYQFSPELFYSALSPENGFEVDSMWALELSPAKRRFRVENPKDAGTRVTLENSWPVELFVVATKVEHRRVFEQPPQQSDYRDLWAAQDNQGVPTARPGAEKLIGQEHRQSGENWKRILRRLPRRSIPGLYYASTLHKVFLKPGRDFHQRFYKPVRDFTTREGRRE